MDNTENMMNPSVVAQIRTPTDDELSRIRELWSALKQAPLPASTGRGVELKTYLTERAPTLPLPEGATDRSPNRPSRCHLAPVCLWRKRNSRSPRLVKFCCRRESSAC